MNCPEGILDAPPQAVKLPAGPNWHAYRPGRPRPARATPDPYPQALTYTAHRDAATGRFAKAPAPPAWRARAPRPIEGLDVRLTRRLTVHDDGTREVIGVRASIQSARAAFATGDISAATLRETEGAISDELLNELNPEARRAWELEQMHAAHRSDKARRGAVSRRRNAKARALAARSGPPPEVEWRRTVSIDTNTLNLAAQAALQGNCKAVAVTISKCQNQGVKLEIRTAAGVVLCAVGGIASNQKG